MFLQGNIRVVIQSRMLYLVAASSCTEDLSTGCPDRAVLTLGWTIWLRVTFLWCVFFRICVRRCCFQDGHDLPVDLRTQCELCTVVDCRIFSEQQYIRGESSGTSHRKFCKAVCVWTGNTWSWFQNLTSLDRLKQIETYEVFVFVDEVALLLSTSRFKTADKRTKPVLFMSLLQQKVTQGSATTDIAWNNPYETQWVSTKLNRMMQKILSFISNLSRCHCIRNAQP